MFYTFFNGLGCIALSVTFFPASPIYHLPKRFYLYLTANVLCRLTGESFNEKLYNLVEYSTSTYHVLLLESSILYNQHFIFYICMYNINFYTAFYL